MLYLHSSLFPCNKKVKFKEINISVLDSQKPIDIVKFSDGWGVFQHRKKFWVNDLEKEKIKSLTSNYKEFNSEKIAGKTWHSLSPLELEIEFSRQCNQKCIHCWNKSMTDGKNINKEKLKETLFTFKKYGGQKILATGGEPLIRKDILYPLANYLSFNKIDVKMNTNLVLITEQDCEKIKNNRIMGVLGSLPSFDEETYNRITQTKNFKKAIEGIKKLVQYGISASVNMVVMQENKDLVYETGKFVHGLGVKSFCATPVSPCEYLDEKSELKPYEIIRTLDDLLRLKNDFKMHVDIVEPLPRCLFTDVKKYSTFLKKDCAAGRLTVAISSSGEVKPCTHVPISYGNVLNEDPRVIWKKMVMWRDGSLTPKKCSSCIEDIVCSKGCREAANLRRGGYTEEDPLIEELKMPIEFREIKEEKRFDKNEKYIFNDLKIRQEEDEYLLFCRSTYTMGIINLQFLNFIKSLKSIEPFSFDGIIERRGRTVEEELDRIFKFLIQRDFIKKVRYKN